jgi:hypothetical protein
MNRNRRLKFFFFLITDHADLWDLDDIDRVDNLTARFWEFHNVNKSVLKSMFMVIRYVRAQHESLASGAYTVK